jgi:inositol-phosphate phosphatase / L-galactose 1-phosphate phosphatase / histidinol-phosphatase
MTASAHALDEADLDRLLHVALRCADRAGEAIRPYYRTPVAADVKADASPVTIADREAEQAVRAVLAAHRPQDGVWGEEYGAVGLDQPFVWIIDPIDGTKSFMAGRPIFATLIALLYHGTPIIGIIDQPITKDRWIGVVCRPTSLNGAVVSTRPCAELSQAVQGSTMPFPQDEFTHLTQTTRHQLWGGDAYSFGLLAAGFLDVIVEAGLQTYDWAALVPVIEGAGGVIVDWQGHRLRLGSDGNVCACGDPALCADVLAAMAASAQDTP